METLFFTLAGLAVIGLTAYYLICQKKGSSPPSTPAPEEPSEE